MFCVGQKKTKAMTNKQESKQILNLGIGFNFLCAIVVTDQIQKLMPELLKK